MTQIKLYTLSTCVHCKQLKRFLSSNGFHFDYIDVDTLTGGERQQVLDEVRALNPRISFPTAIIDGQVVVGYREAEIRRLLGL